uniref:Uncharacterized protein n=1 Tax=Sus scrofa TaxID=9823 RepID=A0A480F4V9_PIG
MGGSKNSLGHDLQRLYCKSIAEEVFQVVLFQAATSFGEASSPIPSTLGSTGSGRLIQSLFLRMCMWLSLLCWRVLLYLITQCQCSGACQRGYNIHLGKGFLLIDGKLIFSPKTPDEDTFCPGSPD